MSELKKTSILVGLGLLGILLTFTPFALLGILLTLLIAAVLWTPVRIFSASLAGRLVACLVLFFTVNTLAAAVTWLLKINFSVTYTTTIIVLLSLWNLRKKPALSIPKVLVSREDVLVLGVTAAIMFMVISPLLKNPSKPELIQTAVLGFDDVSHIELTRAVTENKNYFYTDSVRTSQKVSQGYAGYPQGWHLNAATVNNLIDRASPLNSPIKVLAAYYLNKLIWFGLLLTLLGYATVSVAKIMNKKFTLTGTSTLSFILLSSLSMLMFTLPLFRYGYSTYLGVLVFILFYLTYCLRQIYINGKSQAFENCLTMATAIFAASCFTWLLGAGIVLTVQLVLLLGGNPKEFLTPSNLIRSIQRRPPVYLFSACFVITAFLQPFIQSKYGIIKDPLNDMGGIETFSLFALAAATIILSILFRYYKPNKHIILFLTHAPLPLFVYIYFYQLTSVKASGYFTYKVAYSLAIFLSITFTALALTHMVALSRKMGALYALGSLLVVVSLLPILFEHKFGYFTDIKRQERILSPEAASVLSRYYSTPHYNSGEIIVLRGINTYTEDLNASRLSGALAGDNDRLHHAITDCILSCALAGTPDNLYKEIMRYTRAHPDRKLTIITSSKNDKKVRQQLQKATNISFSTVN